MIIQKKFFSQFRALPLLAALPLAFAWLSCTALAADNSPAGTWKSSFSTPDGQTIESTFKLKQEGDKLSGVLIGRNGNENPMEEVKLTGDQLFIKLVRERNGEKTTTKVTATLSGDNLKGKLETNWGGENRTADWQAKRVKDTADTVSSSASATGSWKYAITLDSGDIMNLVLNLKQEGDKVSGKVSVGDFETPITEGKVAGDVISFKIPVDTGNQKFTSAYKGTLNGDTIKGKIHSDWGGEDHNYDWNASREKTAASSSANATGTWKWVLVTDSGESIDLSLKLKQDGDKLAGVVVVHDNEVPISDGLIKENQISLKITREKDGKTQTAKFQGKLDGDSIKGKIDSDWSGENKTHDWNAKRSS
jgi:hypothetical protein